MDQNSAYIHLVYEMKIGKSMNRENAYKPH